MPKRKRKSNKKQVKVEATAKSIPIPSGQCLPNQCNCILPNEVNISDILISVKKQDAYRDMPARGPLNMVSVELAIVEDYLLHSRKSEHLKAKQVRLREALRRISYKMNMPFLNTINTKTTPFRLFGKALWDGCKLEPDKHKSPELRSQQKDNLDHVHDVLDHLKERYTEDTSPVNVGNALNDLVSNISISTIEQNKCEKAIEVEGIYVHRSLIPNDLCLHLLSSKKKTQKKTKKVLFYSLALQIFDNNNH